MLTTVKVRAVAVVANARVAVAATKLFIVAIVCCSLNSEQQKAREGTEQRTEVRMVSPNLVLF